MNEFLIIVALLLAGCANTPKVEKVEPVVATQYIYVEKLPPAVLMQLPPAVASIDVDTAKQSDIARWLVTSEERMKTLEDQIIGIGAFFVNEQNKLDAEAKVKNDQAMADAIKAQADAAQAAINKPVQK